ncbi:hypothetical protein QUA40_22305 [Microcoleus sp. Pol11C3]
MGDRISPVSISCFLTFNSSNLKPSARSNKRDLTGVTLVWWVNSSLFDASARSPTRTSTTANHS